MYLSIWEEAVIVAAETGTISRYLYFALCVVYALFVLTQFIYWGRNGSVVGTVIATLLASTFPMVVIGLTLEHRSPLQVLNLKSGSWAFVIGDALALPLAIGAAAYVWRSLDGDSWYTSNTWIFCSIALGLFVAGIFHTKDVRVYTDAGSAARLESPTKIFHGYVAYSVLASAIFLLCVPAVIYGWRNSSAVLSFIMVVGIAGWASLGVFDIVRNLNLADLHPKFSWSAVDVIPEDPTPIILSPTPSSAPTPSP